MMTMTSAAAFRGVFGLDTSTLTGLDLRVFGVMDLVISALLLRLSFRGLDLEGVRTREADGSTRSAIRFPELISDTSSSRVWDEVGSLAGRSSFCILAELSLAWSDSLRFAWDDCCSSSVRGKKILQKIQK